MNRIYRHFFLLVVLLALSLCANAQKKKDYTIYVDPFIGTGGHGNTFPGAVVPYAMLQVGPVTDTKSEGSPYRYHYKDTVVYGFAINHLSGIRYPDDCDILFTPTTGQPDVDIVKNGSAFTKKNESASPGYYKTKLNKYDIDVELTATTRAAMQRYSYPSTAQANIIINFGRSKKFTESSIEILNDHELRGSVWSGQTLYFHTKFSKPFKTYGVFLKGQLQDGIKKAEGTDLKLYIQFDNPGEVISKTGISAVSMDGALKNLDTEIPDLDLKKTQKAARTAWINELAKIEVEGGGPTADQEQQQNAMSSPYGYGRPGKKTPAVDYGKQKRIMFYTALYHTMLSPNVYSDVDGKYQGMEKEGLVNNVATHTAEGYTFYTVFSTPTRSGTQWPLLSLIDHKRQTDVIKSFLALYDTKDSLKTGRTMFTFSTIGYLLTPLIVDAYAKGARDFDADKAFSAVNFTWIHNILLSAYLSAGYLYGGSASTVSNTLKFAYNEWCIVQLAKLLNKPNNVLEYFQGAQYWKNIHNKDTGFIQPRTWEWLAPFDPTAENAAFSDGTPWQYAFSVPYDVNTLIARDGGKEQFAAKLDELFTTPAKAGKDDLIGQYAHSSTAGHIAPYLFNFTDDADKTQLYINRILTECYSTKPDGLPGDDQLGQMSAWYVMSSLGIYNIAPGQQQWQVGLSAFDKATVNLENGKKFTILNSGASVARNNIYLQGMSLNKKTYNKLYLNNDDIAGGGEFEVYTGRLANKMFMQDLERPVAAITDNLIVPNPVIVSLKTFAPPAQVEIRSNDVGTGTTIYYTTDGSAPTTSSAVYNKPFAVTAKMNIKAIAVKNGKTSLLTQAQF